jgi:cytochrome P450
MRFWRHLQRILYPEGSYCHWEQLVRSIIRRFESISALTPQQRAILRDPAFGPEPHLFNPERFMSGNQLNPDVPRPDNAFGHGRRICAGKEAAEVSLWIGIASLLATFNFSSDKHKSEDDFASHSSGITSCVFKGAVIAV